MDFNPDLPVARAPGGSRRSKRPIGRIDPKKFFPDYGHFGVYGRTGCGKTYYVKYLIRSMGTRLRDTIVFVNRLCQSQWKESKKIYNDVTVKNLEEVEALAQYNNDNGDTTWVIFDDFITDKELKGRVKTKFERVFSSGRHAGIRAAFLVQYAKMVPPAVRANVMGIVIPANSQQDMLKNIAKMYMHNNWRALSDMQEQNVGSSRYAMLVANPVDSRINIDEAPPPKGVLAKRSLDRAIDLDLTRRSESRQLVENVGRPRPAVQTTSYMTRRDHSTDFDDDDDEGYGDGGFDRSADLSDSMGVSVGPRTEIGNRNRAGRDYHDNSQNNYAVRLDMDLKTDIKMEQHNFKLAKIRRKHEQALWKMDQKDKARRILNKPYITPRDEATLVKVMNLYKKKGERITLANYEAYLAGFAKNVLGVHAPEERTLLDRGMDYGMTYMGEDSITASLASYAAKNTGLLDFGKQFFRSY